MKGATSTWIKTRSMKLYGRRRPKPKRHKRMRTKMKAKKRHRRLHQWTLMAELQACEEQPLRLAKQSTENFPRSQRKRKKRKMLELSEAEEAEARAKEEECQRDPVPGRATRLVPGCIIERSTEAENTDAVDSAARIIDIIIFTHTKRRYQPFLWGNG